MKIEAILLILVLLDAVSTYLLVQKHPVERVLRQSRESATKAEASSETTVEVHLSKTPQLVPGAPEGF